MAGLGYHYTDTIDGLRVINNTAIRDPYGFINNSPNHDKNIAILHNYFDIQNRVETSSRHRLKLRRRDPTAAETAMLRATSFRDWKVIWP